MAVEQSIFKATKVMLDVAPDDNTFNGQIMTFINSALADLNDLGLGPEGGLVIHGDTETWAAIEESPSDTERVKNWLYLKVRLYWDPPQTSFLLEAHERQITEAGWRLVNKKDGERYVLTHPDDGVVVLDGGAP